MPQLLLLLINREPHYHILPTYTIVLILSGQLALAELGGSQGYRQFP